MLKLNSKIIDNANFKKFGSVVKTPRGNPTSQAADYKFWSDISDYKIDGETEIGICTVYKQNKNVVETVERHLKTPEILIPIDAPFVLPVLLDGESEEKVEAFKVDIGESVITNQAVWHGACLPVGKDEASYFVIFRKNTPNEDVEKKKINPIEINI